MVVLDARRCESRLEMRVLLDPDDPPAARVDEPGPSTEEERAPALERPFVRRVGLAPGEPHADHDAIGEADRAIDRDVVVLRDALGEHRQDAISADENGFLTRGHPLDVGIEHRLQRSEIPGDERAVAAQEKVDALVTHAAESKTMSRGASRRPRGSRALTGLLQSGC